MVSDDYFSVSGKNKNHDSDTLKAPINDLFHFTQLCTSMSEADTDGRTTSERYCTSS